VSDVWDVATAGAATFKLTRLITKGKATSFIRAASSWSALLPRAMGRRFGYVAAPRLTRLLTSLYTSLALADFAQIAYTPAVGPHA